MGARAGRRFYVALEDGIVVGSRRSSRWLTHAVLHRGYAGTFATFHESLAGAVGALAAFRDSAPTKAIVRALETREWLEIGVRLLH